MNKLVVTLIAVAVLFTACNRKAPKFDASGTFEVDEVIVSAEQTGKLLSFNVYEGQAIPNQQVVGIIDAENLSLQKEQVQASIAALHDKTADVRPQVKLLQEQLNVQQSQLNNMLHERTRIENLLKQDAATGKQLDDMNSQIEVLQQQMNVTRQQINVQMTNTNTQNRTVLSEKRPLEKRVAQLSDQINKAQVVNPVGGTVLTKYAEAGEVTSAGKALYKIANLDTLTLRAYITGTQLPQIKLNQTVKVMIDSGANAYRGYPGTITWVSDKAEFTPKTIQTKEERANLVYAIKVRVKNDGYLKVGMYGEVLFGK
ncbi:MULTISPECIES: HlyD family secretion protein [Niastella]|uniref:HlyD family efflux transporter periplasmic adaptor subunit n=1 Tax=Niastella soli TaxID=2821487 RepID=A0ABS3YTA9_9BACT|nr:HlyD family efflux transporter periplasmic adaptor subunit [Niastella soli]MBO9201139.1 HlyD family efflux transporter periplasmic adaptor subunit [Niastella soli]